MDRKEFEHLKRIKDRCKKCKGQGYHIVKKNDGHLEINDCRCVETIASELKLIEARIPIEHRNWDFKQLSTQFVKRNAKAVNIIKGYVNALSNNIERGRGLYFYSPPGLAKSSIICNILKKAIKKGFVPYFGRASHLVTLKFQAMRNEEAARETLDYIFNKVDILAIEEIEKVYLAGESSMPNQHFYELLSDIYDARISLLISSNKLREEHEKTLPLFIQDRFKSLTSVPFIGKSGRNDLRKVN